MRASSDADEVMLAWQRAERPGTVEFVVTAGYTDEVLALLAAGDVAARRSPAAFRTTGGELLATVVAVAETPAAWVAIGVAVKAFFDRHKGKRIKVGADGRTDASGYSARDIERIVRSLARPEPTGEDAEDTDQ